MSNKPKIDIDEFIAANELEQDSNIVDRIRNLMGVEPELTFEQAAKAVEISIHCPLGNLLNRNML